MFTRKTANERKSSIIEKVQKGKDILVWATLGLVVIFSAYAVVKLVIKGIAGK
ncbi:hypothetical protein KAI65_04825 [Candidatus Parcubacteria bacterium]|nr:hypothetical protein [Candidatus Parcubacteria bacterium]